MKLSEDIEGSGYFILLGPVTYTIITHVKFRVTHKNLQNSATANGSKQLGLDCLFCREVGSFNGESWFLGKKNYGCEKLSLEIRSGP